MFRRRKSIYEGESAMELKLGANIAALRRAKGMTQEQLAAALGISPPAVSKSLAYRLPHMRFSANSLSSYLTN